MNITYLIGNGFDISIGLDTRYTDFYNYLLENDNRKEGTSNIVKNIKTSVENGDELWSDFELALGNYVENIATEEALSTFMSEKNEIENKLKKYLKNQQERIRWDKETLEKSRQEFYKAVSDLGLFEGIVDDESIYEMINSIDINIINFNYTNIIEKIADKNLISDILYLHGTLDENIILGVNDTEQIKNKEYKNTADMVLSMCKREMMNYDSKKRFQNAKMLIENTDYICIYGISIGETDRCWWDLIIDALMEGKIRRVVIFWHDSDIDLQMRIKTRDMKEEVKNKFLGKYYRDKNIRNNIDVIINSPIFNSVQSIIKDSIEEQRSLECIGKEIIKNKKIDINLR